MQSVSRTTSRVACVIAIVLLPVSSLLACAATDGQDPWFAWFVYVMVFEVSLCLVIAIITMVGGFILAITRPSALCGPWLIGLGACLACFFYLWSMVWSGFRSKDRS